MPSKAAGSIRVSGTFPIGPIPHVSMVRDEAGRTELIVDRPLFHKGRFVGS